jgi:hypothetical protein
MVGSATGVSSVVAVTLSAAGSASLSGIGTAALVVLALALFAIVWRGRLLGPALSSPPAGPSSGSAMESQVAARPPDRRADHQEPLARTRPTEARPREEPTPAAQAPREGVVLAPVPSPAGARPAQAAPATVPVEVQPVATDPSPSGGALVTLAPRAEPALERGPAPQARRIRVMMFVDWANFMQRWLGAPGMKSYRMKEARQIWERLPYDLIDVLESSPEIAGVAGESVFEFAGAQVYDSFVPDLDLALGGVSQEDKRTRYRGEERRILEIEIGTLPGFSVHIADRKVDRQGQGLNARPRKNERGFIESEEKEVDTSLVADMLAFAALGRFDVALLLSDDRDYRPAVVRVQQLWDKKVVHVGFSNTPMLRTVCWSYISLDEQEEEEDEEAEEAGAGAANGGAAAAASSAAPPPPRVRLVVGHIYRGRVSAVTAQGAWIDLPAEGRYGYVSANNVRARPVAELEKELAKGQDVWVKFIGVDQGRRILLSMKVVDQESGQEIPRS